MIFSQGGRSSGGDRPAPTTGQEGALISILGILRLVLAATVVLLLVVSQEPFWLTGVYLALGVSFVFGGLLVASRSKSLLHRPLVGVLIDALAVTLLVAGTGGERSLFSPLYFLAALGLSRTRGVVWMAIGAGALVLGYIVGVAAPERSLEPLLSFAVAFEAGLIALFGGAAALGGSVLRTARVNGDGHASALAAERRYADKTGSITSRFGPVLAALSVEERLRWTVETIRESLGVPYAHATTSDGSFHQTSVRGDRDAYPSWWHPEVQRLVLWSCRTGEVLHSDAEVHGTEGFVTAPLVAENGENVGAIVAGGRSFDVEDERVLRLLAAPVASALAEFGEAPGGIDPVSGVPNQDSLDRVLHRESSFGKPPALVVVGPDYPGPGVRNFGFAAKNAVLRTVGQRLKESNYRVFRCGDGTFAVLPREVGDRKTRAAALRIRRIAEEADAGPAILTAAGFVVAERWPEEPGALLEAARAALRTAWDHPDRVAEAAMSSGSPSAEMLGGLLGGEGAAQIVRAFEEAIEVRDPNLGEHSRAVSKISLLVGARMALPAEQIEALVVGGLLHDLGKIGLPDSILNKPAALSPEEYEVIKQHPVLGARILDLIPELSSVVPVVRHHHERFDGGGYPEGLWGEDVPLPARIVLVADAFDSMTRDRVYRSGIDEDSALEELMRNSGTQFDPEVVEVLREVIAEPDGRQAVL